MSHDGSIVPIRLGVTWVEKLAVRPGGVASGEFVLVEWTAEIGDHWIAPLHVHHSDDEAWYVLDGELGFRLGNEVVMAGAGSAVVAPRGTPHTYWNAGNVEARYLLVMPTRIARLIEAIHAPGADIPALFTAHNSELLPSG
jgi:mannose-6-phosphate isomerase-like protein (cupin superfamily)